MQSTTLHANDTEAERTTRAAACHALGIDPETVAWPGETQIAEPVTQAIATAEDTRLDDEEWRVIADLLPAEAPQAGTMSNRAFLDAVLAAMRRGGAWTSRATSAADIEAVRRRFGRWAQQGIFQVLADALPDLALSPERKRLLALAGQRATQLKARSTR